MDWGCFMSKVVIISANYGGYDAAKNTEIDGVKRNFINEEKLPLNLSPMIAAKFVKLNPFFFGEHEYYIWIDGSYEVVKDGFVEKMIESLGDKEVAFLEHKNIWGRTNIYDEAEFCKDIPKYKGQDMAKQVNLYWEAGLPQAHKLYAGGLYICRRSPNTEKMFQIWWEQNLLMTYQDQLSLPYAIWKSNVEVTSLPDQIFSDYLKLHEHLK